VLAVASTLLALVADVTVAKDYHGRSATFHDPFGVELSIIARRPTS
jgi:hypothetical protein